MFDLSVIIVNYNVKFFLDQALRSIAKALEGVRAEVFVVDNGSTDGSQAIVRSRFPNVRLIENAENKGFAKANNQALGLAEGRAVCLINPDTLVREDTFRICLDYLNGHPDVGAVGCKILNPDGTLQPACRRSFPTPWVAFTKIIGLSALFPRSRWFGRYNLTYLDPEQTADVEALSGSFMMVSKRAVDDAGMLDEDFFLYGEDLDWCYRIREKGWRIVYLPQTEIVHYKGRSAREAPFDALRLFYGAMLLFVNKHFRSGWTALPRGFMKIGILLRGALSFLSRLAARFALPLFDAILLQAGLALAIFIRFGNLAHWGSYGVVNAAYSIVWLSALYLMGSYERDLSFSKSTSGILTGLLVNTSLTFFFPQYAFSRKVVLLAAVLDTLLLGGWRILFRFLARIKKLSSLRLIGRSLTRRRVVVVGTDESAVALAKKLQYRQHGDGEPAGLIATSLQDGFEDRADLPVLGVLSDLRRIVIAHRIDEVIFAPGAAQYHEILSVVSQSKGLRIDFKMVPTALDVMIGHAAIDPLNETPLVDLDYRIFFGPNATAKRLLDLAVSLILVPVLLPIGIYLIFNPRIRFRRFRIQGEHDRPIMLHLPERNGKRIPSVFRLVSFWPRVLQGRMSWIGSDWSVAPHAVRHGLKPGVTGLVQLYHPTSQEEKDRLETFYMRQYSLGLDLGVLFKTLFRQERHGA